MTKYFNEQFQAAWKQKAANKTLTANDFFLRALYKALDSKSNNKQEVFLGLLTKYFTPITNANKLANGCTPWSKIESLARNYLWWSRGKDNNAPQEAIALIQSVVVCDPLKGWLFNTKDVTYVYFFTRQDISPAQQLVQTAHAASVVGKEAIPNPHEQHFIVFGVKDLGALKAKHNELFTLSKTNGFRLFTFFEPDMNNEMTSFATSPIRGSFARRKGWFKNDQLLTI